LHYHKGLFKKSFVCIKLKCAPDIINYATDETPEHILHCFQKALTI